MTVDDTSATPPGSALPGETTLSRWDRWSFEAARVATRFAVRTISLTGLYHVGRAFATLEWLTNYKRRRRFAATLVRTMGPDLPASQRRMHTWRHFVRTRCDKLFYLVFDHLSEAALRDRFEIVNRHLLDDGIAAGNGAYVAMSHMGAHHVVAMLLVQMGYKVAVGRDENVGAIRLFMQRKQARKNRDHAAYFYSTTYPRVIYRYFKDNYLVGSAIDVAKVRSEHLKTIEVNVFGEKRAFLTGPMQIAVRCGAPVVQGFVISRTNFRYVLDLYGPLIDPTDATASLDDGMKAYAANMERLIRQYPCHVSKI